jgi:lactate dehydrogenase-like 2-hydroxyacid dehydrogenase
VDAKLRVVTHLPLRELWRDDGFLTTARDQSLTEEGVRKFLASGFVQFVVVDVGTSPRWIPKSECFRFWKSEVKPHLASEERASLQEFPGGYCYFAFQWNGGEPAEPIVVLEKHH